MRFFDTATAAALAQRGGFDMHALVWVTARNPVTGDPATIGFWTGADTVTFIVDGEERSYIGCGDALSVDPILMQAGYLVQGQRLSLAGLSPAAILLLRTYDARFAPIEIRRAVFDLQTTDLVAEPHVMFRGTIDAVDLPTPAKGGTAQAEVSMVSSARAGTRTLALRKSDEALRARSPADAFRQYIAVSNAVPVWWGEQRVGQSAAPRVNLTGTGPLFSRGAGGA